MRAWVAACTTAQADVLARYDHHVVQVNGKQGLLLTDHWNSVRFAGKSRLTKYARVVFQHVADHPPVPDRVQAVIDELYFSETDINL